MLTFKSWEWVCIEIATQYGLDKLTFDKRLAWTLENMKQLEELGNAKEWKEKPLYIKAVMAWRSIQQGNPTGLMIALDGSTSGIQIMSALTGCHIGAKATGLVDKDRRADAYTDGTVLMNEELHTKGNAVDVPRSDMKQAVMTAMYASKKVPRELFGSNTEELAAFYVAVKKLAPGAWELLQDLLGAWQPYAKKHSWVVADGFDCRVKVMKDNELRIQVEELGNASFTYTYYENEGSKKGLSLGANVIHSQDALLVREMHRRVNYNYDVVMAAQTAINQAILGIGTAMGNDAAKYADLWEQNKFATAAVLPLLVNGAQGLSKEHLTKLAQICTEILANDSKPLVTIHDSFATLPSGVDGMRKHYRSILADMADSNILSSLFSQIMGKEVEYAKVGTGLGDVIRESEYGIC